MAPATRHSRREARRCRRCRQRSKSDRSDAPKRDRPADCPGDLSRELSADPATEDRRVPQLQVGVNGIGRSPAARAFASDVPPKYERKPTPTSFSPFESRVRVLLEEHPAMPATALAERVGCDGSITWFWDNARWLRQRTAARIRHTGRPETRRCGAMSLRRRRTLPEDGAIAPPPVPVTTAEAKADRRALVSRPASHRPRPRGLGRTSFGENRPHPNGHRLPQPATILHHVECRFDRTYIRLLYGVEAWTAGTRPGRLSAGHC